MNTIYSGVTSAEPKTTDYTIGSDMIQVTIQNAPFADANIVQANQNRDRRYYYTCVVHATCGAICDFWNVSNEVYLEFIEKVVVKAVELGKLNLESGMGVADCIDIARNIWNSWKPEKAMNSFRIPFSDPALDDVMKKGHSIVTAYRGNAEWNSDVEKDGTLDKNRYSPTTYGHSVRAREGVFNPLIANNYEGVSAYNLYRIKYMASLVANGVNFWDCFYLFLPKEWITDSQTAQFNAVKLGIWNGSNPDKTATRFECATMIARKLYGKDASADQFTGWNKQDGSREISQEEMTTMFERAGFKIPANTTRGAIAEVLGR